MRLASIRPDQAIKIGCPACVPVSTAGTQAQKAPNELNFDDQRRALDWPWTAWKASKWGFCLAGMKCPTARRLSK